MEAKTNAVATQQPKDKVITYKANGKDIQLSKAIVINYLTSGNGKVSEQEVVNFINLCKFNELNPFLREAYLVKFGTAPAQMITSAEALRKRAEASGHLKGITGGVIVQRGSNIEYIKGAFKLKNDILVGGWCTVYRDDKEIPYEISISFEEYSKDQSTWKTMPCTMIAKCAQSKALREAFPGILGGMITQEEQSTDPNAKPFANTKTDRLREMAEQAQMESQKTIVIPEAEEVPVDEIPAGLFDNEDN